MKKVIFAQILLLAGCDQRSDQQVSGEPWPNEAEVLFQEAEALKYTLEQQELESLRLEAQGLEGAPPAPRR